VKLDEVEIPKDSLSKAADFIWEQLGPQGQIQVGGKQWWQWRPKNTLKAEWIEMRKDYHARKKRGDTKGNRIMLYVHGGAYYFGSVDAHRYQLQRHARKLKARLLAPRYRLAPQFPFPCGLQDNLAAYIYLLETYDPSTILLAGDSAGGGMVLALLVTIRDRGLPLPAGAILISPWVDLTHSFPSLCGDGKEDYIPSHGFVHKPSMSWPPPNADDLKFIKEKVALAESSHGIPSSKEEKQEQKQETKEDKKDRIRGYSLISPENDEAQELLSADPRQNLDTFLSIEIDGQLLQIKDQIQLYATNYQLLHPLVSPIVQATLGGLPPLLIISGGGELLKDEQMYLAHKAANPQLYAPAPSVYQSEEFIRAQIAKYPPTNVQFQLWDDLCHVATTLSFTRPAKFMYRSIAQFSAWALARAQNASIDILDDDALSIISTESTSSVSREEDGEAQSSQPTKTTPSNLSGKSHLAKMHTSVGKAGDPIPPFTKHIVRQRVDRHGLIYPLPPPEDISTLKIPPAAIGIVKEGPVRKWMYQQSTWNRKFAKEKLRVQNKRVQDMIRGYEGFEGENPPPSALAGRRIKGMTDTTKKKKSWAMMMWSGWGSKHDEQTVSCPLLRFLGRTL
jgi:acetyl esterase/lipase